MNSVCGKVLAVFFAACFLALQFHNLDHTEIEHNTGRIIRVEDTRTSEIDKKIHNKSIYAQVVPSHHEFSQRYLSIYNLWTFHLNWGARHWETLDFQKELQGELAAFCEVYQVKLSTTFNFLQALSLTFERISTLHAHHKQIQSDESDNYVS